MKSNHDTKSELVVSSQSPQRNFNDLLKVVKTILDVEDVKENTKYKTLDSQAELVMSRIYDQLFKVGERSDVSDN